MPRLRDSGPTLVSSPFDVDPLHTYVALAHAHGLKLYDSADGRELSSLELELGGDVDLVFCLSMGVSRLIMFARGEESTDVRAFSLPRLEPSGRLEMIGRVYPATATLDQVVVWNESRENVRIVGVAPTTLSSAAFPLREPVQLAVATPEHQILAAARDQYEVWDPLARRASFRIQLPVPRPYLGGFAARRRTLWLLSGPQASMQLDVLRFSDGRPQGRINLGRKVLAVDGQTDSERALFVMAGTAGPELALLDLTTLEREPFVVEGEIAAACLVEGNHPAVVVADGDGVVRFLPVAAAPLYLTAITERRAQPGAGRPQLPRRVERVSRGDSGAVGLGRPAPTWRKGLAAKTEPEPEPEPDGDSDGDPPSDEPEEAESPPQRSKPEPETRAAIETPPPKADAGPSPAWRQQLSRAPSVPEPTATKPARRPQPRATTIRTWRDAVVAASEATNGAELYEQMEHSPLADVMGAFQLSSVARAALILCYAAWLDGRVKGWAASEMVEALRRLCPGEEDELMWLEALGAGELGQRHLIESRRGRARLHRVTGRFLDGGAPVLRIFGHDGSPARHEVELGAYRVVSTGLEETLGRVSRALGHNVAVVDLRHTPPAQQRRELEAAILEAHLESAVPLLLPSDPHSDGNAAMLEALQSLDGRLLVVAVPEGAAGTEGRLGALPPLPLD